MTSKPQALVDAARSVKPTEAHREEQRRSFAFGNTGLANGRITREMVDRKAEKLAAERPSDDRK